MKERTILILGICSLFTINIFTLVRYKKLKQQLVVENNIYKDFESNNRNELNAYKTNFIANTLNSNYQLCDMFVKDSCDNEIPLNSILRSNQNQILVCRFPHSHCQSCVNSLMQILHSKIDSIGKDNIMLWGNNPNHRIFKRTMPLYGTKGLTVYNVPPFKIPADQLGYPYCFILDSNLQILNVFIPDKGVRELTID